MASVIKVDTIKSTTGNTALTISESGVPQLNVPAFDVVLSANQSVTAATATVIQLDSVQFDTNNYWDASNFRYTPQIAGYYQFNGQVYGIASNEDAVFGGFFKNGADTLVRSDIRLVPGGTDISLAILNFSWVFYMNGSTDNVQLFIYVNGTTTTAGAFYSRLSGFLVRAA